MSFMQDILNYIELHRKKIFYYEDEGSLPIG